MTKHEPPSIASYVLGEQHADFHPDFVRLLGRLVIQFTSLEEVLRETIGELTGAVDEVGEILTTGLTFPMLVDKYACLCIHWLPEGADTSHIDDLRMRLIRLNERRNAIIHSVWALDVGTGVAVRDWRTARGRDGLQWQSEDVTHEMLEPLIKDLIAAADHVWGAAEPSVEILDGQRPRPRRWLQRRRR
jgi:hypothetical protein